MILHRPQTSKFLVVILCLLALVLVVGACKSGPEVETPTQIPPTATQTAPPPTPTPTATLSPMEPVSEGDAYLLESRFAEALQAYEGAIEIDPTFSPAYSRLSQLYYWTGGMEDEALEAAEKAVELDPENAGAYIALTWANLQAYNYDRAIEAGLKAVELDPKNAVAHAALARAYTSNYDLDLAKEAMTAAYQLDPDNAQVMSVIGYYHRIMGDHIRAEVAFQESVDLEPEFFPWRINLGYFYLERDLFELAGDEFEAARDLAPENLSVVTNQVYLALYKNDFKMAEAYLEEADEIAPESIDVIASWGYYYLFRRNFDLAIERFKEVLEVDPENIVAKGALGDTYLQQQECKLAADVFDELTEQNPRVISFLLGRGRAFMCSSDMGKTLIRFREAEELNPNDYRVQGNLAWAYQKQERAENAQEAYVKALSLSPSLAGGHLGLSQWYLSQGDIDNAEAEGRIAFDMNPSSITILLHMTEIYKIKGDLEEAEEMVALAYDLDNENTRINLSYGIIQYLLGEPEKAAEMFEVVLDEDPDDVEGNYYLGLADKDLGDYKEASEHLSSYISLAADSLDDSRASMVNILIDGLDEGYLMTEEDALGRITQVMEAISESPPTFRVDDFEDAGRTLIFDIKTKTGNLEDQEAILPAAVAVSLGLIYGPRIDPEITNGLQLNITQYGVTKMRASVPLDDLKKISSGLLPASNVLNDHPFVELDSEEKPLTVREILSGVEDIRELSPKDKVTQVYVSKDDVRDMLNESVDQEVRESIKVDEVFLETLGVITTTTDLEEVWIDMYNEQILGYYKPTEDTLYIVEGQDTSAVDNLTIAHEYTHALQDQEFDLESLTNDGMNDDQVRAIKALIEGDATLSSILWANKSGVIGEIRNATVELSGVSDESVDKYPTFLQELAKFPYTKGIEFVNEIYKRGSWKAVNEVYLDLPKSTEQILHPEIYRKGEDPKIVKLPELEGDLVDEWEEIEENVMGEYLLLLDMLEQVGPMAAQKAADGWGGDRYFILENENDGTYLLGLQTTWDDEDEAGEFWELYQVFMAHRQAYEEIVEVLVDDVHVHYWVGESKVVSLSRDGLNVTIVIGPSREIVDEVGKLMRDGE